MSPVFKNFLQGLLCKDTNKRLTWPHLAEHEFIKTGVKSNLHLSRIVFVQNTLFTIIFDLK